MDDTRGRYETETEERPEEMTRPAVLIFAVVLLTLPFYGASCGESGGGGGGGGAKDTGIDRDSGGPAPVKEEPEDTNFEPREFSGNGGQNIGTVKVPGDAIFEWTNEDDPAFRTFSAFDSDFQLSVTSDGESGKSVMPAGTYPNIDVFGGDWTITIRPSG